MSRCVVNVYSIIAIFVKFMIANFKAYGMGQVFGGNWEHQM